MNHEEKSKETYSVVKAMEDALAASSNDMGRYFHEEFRWMGNQGCGTKQNLEEFRNNWQLPLRAAFTDRIYKTCLLYTSPSPRDGLLSRMPSSA
mgnify:CR=1 FL=1